MALQCSGLMKNFVWALLIVFPIAMMAEEASPKFDAKAAERFADLALACVGKEYPNKISHLLKTWLPKLSHPVRIGEHNQTAFALGLLFDYAWTTKNDPVRHLVSDRIINFFKADKDCSLNYEPSGEDFLSPCLGEADAMRRVMVAGEFAKWLSDFLPQIPTTATTDWLPTAVSPDPSDPKLAHLDGLNLSRAWMLEGILSALPRDDQRRAALQAAADGHRRAGLAAVTGAHYEGGHWLGSFAVYLTTQRGIQKEETAASQQAKDESERTAH